MVKREAKTGEIIEAGSNLPATMGGNLESLRRAWLAEVQARTGSDRTPAEYGRWVDMFLSMPGIEGNPSKATPAHATAFGYAPKGNGESPSSSATLVRLAAVRSFYSFAHRNGLPWGDPTAEVKRPQKKAASVRGLSADELSRLLKAIPETPSGKRDKAAVLVSAFMGLRRAELFSLSKGSLTRNGRVYLTWKAKGGKERTREIPAPAFRAIEEAVKAQGETLETMKDGDPLFPVSSHGFYLNLRRYAGKAGLSNVSPHVLRHSCAKLRRQAGASIEDVSAVLGHSDIAVTARYLKRLEGEEDTGWAGVADLLGV